MCAKMDTDGNPVSFAPDWIEALLKEYEEETKMEARWPTLLLQSTGRKLMWSLCSILGVNTKGVPGSACRLLERYLSRHIRSFLQEPRDSDEWERYKDMLTSRFYLLMVSCIQLAAKMSDLLAPLSATMMRTTLMREGVLHTKAEIVEMEFHVYSTLDFRIPLWTTLEVAEFLATQVGLGEPSLIEAVGLVVNLSEFHRDQLELHMRCWQETCNTPGSSSSSTSIDNILRARLVQELSELFLCDAFRFSCGINKYSKIISLQVPAPDVYAYSSKASLHNLHVCAGAVSATARYMRSSVAEPTDRLATIIRTNFSHLKAISDTILNHIIPEKKHIPILKKRRLR